MSKSPSPIFERIFDRVKKPQVAFDDWMVQVRAFEFQPAQLVGLFVVVLLLLLVLLHLGCHGGGPGNR